MRRIIFSLVCVVFAVISVYGQDFSPVEKVINEGEYSVAVAGQKTLPINPYLHERLVKEPGNYLMLDFVGTDGSVRTLIRKDKISEWNLGVDTVEYVQAYDMALVKFSDKSMYLTKNLEWLKVQVGQHVSRQMYDGETKTMVHVKTIERAAPLHEGNAPYAWEWRDDKQRLLSAIILPGAPLPPLLKRKSVPEKAEQSIKEVKNIVAQVTSSASAPQGEKKVELVATTINTQNRPALIRR